MVVTEECSLLPRRLSQRNLRVGFCRFVAGCCVLALISIAAIGSSVEEPYAVQHLDLPAISSPMWESHAAMDPITGDLWFVRSNTDFSRWQILVSHCGKGILEPPTASPVAGRGIEADPYFSSDGRTLYYISSRRTGSRSSSDLDIWKVSRDSRGRWLKPERLAEPVNSAFAEWFPRPAADGWLYFGSRRPGGFGQDDIWKAKLDSQGRWTVDNAGPEINSPDAEYEFLPSPDGGWALLSTNKGIYRLEHSPGGLDETSLAWQRGECKWDGDWPNSVWQRWFLFIFARYRQSRIRRTVCRLPRHTPFRESTRMFSVSAVA
jgi:hypothetical protein